MNLWVQIEGIISYLILKNATENLEAAYTTKSKNRSEEVLPNNKIACLWLDSFDQLDCPENCEHTIHY